MCELKTRVTGQCIHCKRDGLRIVSRGLCSSCYRIDSIRNSYPASDRIKPLDPNREPCRHCKVRNGIKYKLGLCVGCYGTRRIRDLYVSFRVTERPEADEPTLEELDAIIAERMKDLPDWWRTEPPEDPELPPSLPRVVAAARGIRAFNKRRGRE